MTKYNRITGCCIVNDQQILSLDENYGNLFVRRPLSRIEAVKSNNGVICVADASSITKIERNSGTIDVHRKCVIATIDRNTGRIQRQYGLDPTGQ